jgi:hypothetical protein
LAHAPVTRTLNRTHIPPLRPPFSSPPSPPPPLAPQTTRWRISLRHPHLHPLRPMAPPRRYSARRALALPFGTIRRRTPVAAAATPRTPHPARRRPCRRPSPSRPRPPLRARRRRGGVRLSSPPRGAALPRRRRDALARNAARARSGGSGSAPFTARSVGKICLVWFCLTCAPLPLLTGGAALTAPGIGE